MHKDYSFKSENLSYRGVSADDAELIVSWRSNPANYRFCFKARPITLEEHIAWFNTYLKDETRYDFMIIDGDGRRIGTTGLSGISEESCEISYMIGDVSSRGKGYASEAVKTMVEVAFEELGVSEVLARIVSGNDASVKVVTSRGFVEVERTFRIARSSSAAPSDE